ncbi:MAG: redox-sensing transcriptional repressor Rex [Acidimicrobiales bacterium]
MSQVGPGPPGRRIPEATVERLPVYQRIVVELLRAGEATVSSEQLAGLARVNAAMVRKDLSLLGSFGTRGTGYDAAYLASQIDRALGVDRGWPVVVVGAGNLGRALVNSEGFSSRGFSVVAVYDIDPELIGQPVGPVTVRSLDDLGAVKDVGGEAAPAIGVITTPPAAAQGVADRLVAAGVRSILNFAPRVLVVPPRVLLRYVDLSIELQVMSFYLSQSERLGPGSVTDDDVPILRSVGLTPTVEGT